MKDEKIVYSTQELAKRWGVSSADISRLKSQGVIKPMPGFCTKYSIDMISSVEMAGIEGLSCVQRLRFENRIKGLERTIEELNHKLDNVKKFVGGL